MKMKSILLLQQDFLAVQIKTTFKDAVAEAVEVFEMNADSDYQVTFDIEGMSCEFTIGLSSTGFLQLTARGYFVSTTGFRSLYGVDGDCAGRTIGQALQAMAESLYAENSAQSMVDGAQIEAISIFNSDGSVAQKVIQVPFNAHDISSELEDALRGVGFTINAGAKLGRRGVDLPYCSIPKSAMSVKECRSVLRSLLKPGSKYVEQRLLANELKISGNVPQVSLVDKPIKVRMQDAVKVVVCDLASAKRKISQVSLQEAQLSLF